MDFAFLDVAIGMIFFFLVLSIIVTWLQEMLATLLAWRSNHLVNYIQTMLDPTTEKIEGVKKLEKLRKEGIKGDLWKFAPEGITSLDDRARVGVEKLKENAILAFYEHPLINSLSKPKGWGAGWLPERFKNLRFPSYIAPQDFSKALLDILKDADAEVDEAKDDFDRIKKGLDTYLESTNQQNHPLSVILERVDKSVDAAYAKVDEVYQKYDKAEIAAEVAIEKLPTKVEEAQKEIEAWFNSFMDRASGWYKRFARAWALALGLIVALIFNADTLQISIELWENQALRTQIAAQAVEFVQQQQQEGEGVQMTGSEAEETLVALGLPIGWQLENLPNAATSDNLALDWGLKVFGWIITGIAISQGSAYWFDLLNRVVKVRGSGSKPEDKD
jgi:hypothetical protein